MEKIDILKLHYKMNKIEKQIQTNFLCTSQEVESHFERIDCTKKARYYSSAFGYFLKRIDTKANDLKSILEMTHQQITQLQEPSINQDK